MMFLPKRPRLSQILSSQGAIEVEQRDMFPDQLAALYNKTDPTRVYGRVVTNGADKSGWVIMVLQKQLFWWNIDNNAQSGTLELPVEEPHCSPCNTIAARIKLIFDTNNNSRVVGVFFLSLSGGASMWKHDRYPTEPWIKCQSGQISLVKDEQITSIEHISVPGTLLFVCGTSHGRLFSCDLADSHGKLLRSPDINEIMKPQKETGIPGVGIISGIGRMFGYGGNYERQYINSIVSFEGTLDDNCDGWTFVMSNSELSLWSITSDEDSRYVMSVMWSDDLRSGNDNSLVNELNLQLPGISPSQLTLHNLKVTQKELIVLASYSITGTKTQTDYFAIVYEFESIRPTFAELIHVSTDFNTKTGIFNPSLAVTETPRYLIIYLYTQNMVAMTTRPAYGSTRWEITKFNLQKEMLIGGGIYHNSCYLLNRGCGVIAVNFRPTRNLRHGTVRTYSPLAKIDDIQEQKHKHSQQIDSQESKHDVSFEGNFQTALQLFASGQYQNANSKVSQFWGLLPNQEFDSAVTSQYRRAVNYRPPSGQENRVDLFESFKKKKLKVACLRDFLEKAYTDSAINSLWNILGDKTQLDIIQDEEKLEAAQNFHKILLELGEAEEHANEDSWRQDLITQAMRSVVMEETALAESLKEGFHVQDIFFSNISSIDKILAKAVYGISDGDMMENSLWGEASVKKKLVDCDTVARIIVAIVKVSEKRERVPKISRKQLPLLPWTFNRKLIKQHFDNIITALEASGEVKINPWFVDMQERLVQDMADLAKCLLMEHTSYIKRLKDIQEEHFTDEINRLELEYFNDRRKFIYDLKYYAPNKQAHFTKNLANKFKDYRALIQFCDEEIDETKREHELGQCLAHHGEKFAAVLIEQYLKQGKIGALLGTSRDHYHAKWSDWLHKYLKEHPKVSWLHDLNRAEIFYDDGNMEQQWATLINCANTLQKVALDVEVNVEKKHLLSLSKLAYWQAGDKEKAAKIQKVIKSLNTTGGLSLTSESPQK